jgi:hypothetical protein
MRQTKEKSGQYFRTVARFFFEQRGAPFFLSSRELEIIAGWDKTGIPVQIVLQGIKESFQNRKKRPGREGRFHSLVFCQPFVQKAFEAHKERKVGKNWRPSPKKDKRKEIKRAVSQFLEACPEEIQKVKQIYSHVQKQFCRGIDEQMLEIFDQEVEALLLQEASAEETKRIREEVFNEFRISDKKEINRISDLKLAKQLREKYKIPYLSLFYY